MTGFGQGTAENDRYRIEVVLRSVNHRYLDLAVHLPEDCRAHEAAVAECLRRRLARGRVDCRVSVEPVGEGRTRVSVRREALQAVRSLLDELAAEGLVAGELSVSDLLGLREVVEMRAVPGEWRPEDGDLLLATVAAARDRAVAARVAEGEKLRGSLGGLLEALEDAVAALASRRPQVQARLLEALRARLAELAAAPEVPAERLAQEAAILVDRSDIQEELDRLRAHLGEVRSLLESSGPAGRKLDFLMQEVLRELNTIGAKCRDAEMAGGVVDGKLLCEQIREQVQNIE